MIPNAVHIASPVDVQGLLRFTGMNGSAAGLFRFTAALGAGDPVGAGLGAARRCGLAVVLGGGSFAAEAAGGEP